MHAPTSPQPLITFIQPPPHRCAAGGTTADLVKRGTRRKARRKRGVDPGTDPTEGRVQRFWCPACGKYFSGGPVEHLRPLHTPETTREVLMLAVKGRAIEAMARKLSLSREAIGERLGKLEQEARRQWAIHPPGRGRGYACVVSPLTWRGQSEPHVLVAAIGIRRTGRRLLGWRVEKAGEEAAAQVQLTIQFGEASPDAGKPPALVWLRQSLGTVWTLARNQAAIEQRLWLLMAWSHGWKLTGKRPRKNPSP